MSDQPTPEEVYIVCSRGVPDEVDPENKSELTADVCRDCGESIVLMPSTVSIHEDHPHARLVCGQCGAERIKEHGDMAEIQQPTAEQMAEMVQATARKLWP